MSGPDRNLKDFLSEAQETVEAFSRCLVELDAQHDAEEYDPDLLNAAFRAVHSLKGMSGMFGATEVATLSHVLESLLDDLRLSKIDLNQAVLDVLFAAVEAFQHQLAAFAKGGGDAVDVSELLARLEGLRTTPPSEAAGPSIAGIDESILGVLTEYEEHRLRENVRLGRHLYRVHATFDLLAIDVGIEALKEKMKAYGEVITYLPSTEGGADDRIALDILLGSKCTLAEITAGVADDGVTVHAVSGGDGTVGGSGATGASGEGAPPAPGGGAPSGGDAPSRAGGGGRSEAGARGEPVASAAPASVPAVVEGPTTEVASAPTEDGEFELRSLSQTVRVDLERLDNLMNLVGELGVVHASLTGLYDELRMRSAVSDLTRALQIQIRGMERKLSLLQQAILEVRMVPLGQVFDKLKRVVRKLGRDAQKDIRLHITGSETELDKLIVEELSAPLMHMVRNCIDHGIEFPSERIEAGKPATGRIDLRAFQKGNRVVLEVEDDGRGMDWRRIRDRAVARGLVSAEDARNMEPRRALDLIFEPGFSTRDESTELSGRGVGMDVVRTNITRLSGMIDVDTEPGRGTRLAITLPVSLAIIQALVIQSAGQTFCIPLNSVLEAIMLAEDDILTVEGHEVVSLRGQTLPILHLSRLFDLPGGELGYLHPDRIHVVVVGVAQHRVGLVVDDLLGQQDVVVKPLGEALRRVPGISGATELGSNRTVLLLDVAALVTEALRRTAGGARGIFSREGAARVH